MLTLFKKSLYFKKIPFLTADAVTDCSAKKSVRRELGRNRDAEL